ncbi:MAG TPA: MmgE/PrpD family protein [Vicinamibacterales bacterium]|nr:MmgE/PrpD family protein [Vicinamibacterales bacterium]
MTLASQVAEWVARVRFEDLPADVVEATKLRILDVLGLALAGAETRFGRAIRAGTTAVSPAGPCRILGTGDKVGVTSAAFANASFPQALEFDDTHNESIVHMSSPSVAATLALSETRVVSGKDAILTIALSNEIACRVGVVAPGQFHRRGFHPTGLFSPFGIAYGIGKLLELDPQTLAHAAGTCGSFAAGVLECWVDGTDTKFLHSGWAAQSGLSAAMFAAAGVTGPPKIFEGRFGLFSSHLQDPAAAKKLNRIVDGLGSHWESRYSSFKPFPAAHVLHPYISAILRLRDQGVRPDDVRRIECPVAEFNVSIVCEPVEEKRAPASQAHCRVCLQYTLAEALYCGRLGRDAYEDRNRLNPEILSLARTVDYYVDPEFPGPGRFKGAVRVTLKDGRVLTEVEEYNRGSAENPMTPSELRAKFDDNAGGVLTLEERDRLATEIGRTENLSDVSTLVGLAVRSINAS